MQRSLLPRIRRAQGFAALAALALVSSEARADPVFQAVGDTSVGYTDNLQSSPSVPIPGGAPKTPGAFLLLSPGAVVASASPSAIHRLKYTYTFNLFFDTTSASTSSNQIDYQGFFDLTPRFTLLVGASAIQSNQYSAVVVVPPGAGSVNALPAGSGSFLMGTVNEIGSYELTPDLRGYEGLAITEQTPLFGTVSPSTFAPTARLGIERQFQENALGLEARADYSLVENALSVTGTPLGQQSQVIGTGVAIWRHDWARSLTSRVEAGGLRLQRFTDDTGVWEPVGSAALTYTQEMGDATLGYAHTVTTNPLLGQTLLIDEVSLRGAVPITKRGDVLALASAGYQIGRIFGENLALAAHVDALLADVGLGWQTTDQLLLGVRYQHIEQISDTRVPPLPLSFVRNSVMLGLVFKFPAEREMPRAYRPPRRVDAADEIRDAVEPTQGAPQSRPGAGGT